MFRNQHEYTYSLKNIAFTCPVVYTQLRKYKALFQKKSHHDFPFHMSLLIPVLVTDNSSFTKLCKLRNKKLPRLHVHNHSSMQNSAVKNIALE